ncbi:Hypothetical protein A7982_01280 [Minicystis rosea]|nr:Hypothetical protein A7982_01280 [Minicystis rosea]
MAHARRKFHEALAAALEAQEALTQNVVQTDQHHAQSTSDGDEIHRWLMEETPQLPPKGRWALPSVMP